MTITKFYGQYTLKATYQDKEGKAIHLAMYDNGAKYPLIWGTNKFLSLSGTSIFFI